MPPPSKKPDKSAIRNQVRQARGSIPGAIRAQNDRSINHAIVEFLSNEDARRIGAYLAFDGEPDIGPSLHHLAGAGVEVFLPVLSGHGRARSLEFRHWIGPGDERATELPTNSFGIREPVAGRPCEIDELDLLLIPLVAWDKAGNRIGMGAGYYDRVLAPCANKPSPLRVGVAYQLQKVGNFRSAAHDVRLHHVLTEDGLFTCET